MEDVGLFFYVNDTLLKESNPISEAETYGDFMIGKRSHYDVWDEKYYEKYRRPYDYYPRGRVAFNFIANKYVLYADKCIDEKGIKEIMGAFNIESVNIEIDRTDSHYVCKKCNKDYNE